MENEPSEIDLILKARDDKAVSELLARDSNADIFITRLDIDAIQQINAQYPNLLITNSPVVYSVNIVSGKMENKQGYKKIRIYFTPKFEILKRFET